MISSVKTQSHIKFKYERIGKGIIALTLVLTHIRQEIEWNQFFLWSYVEKNMSYGKPIWIQSVWFIHPCSDIQTPEYQKPSQYFSTIIETRNVDDFVHFKKKSPHWDRVLIIYLSLFSETHGYFLPFNSLSIKAYCLFYPP